MVKSNYFVLRPNSSARAAKRHELILVPSDDFGVEGYLRLAYCVPTDMIRRSMGAFAALAKEFGLCAAGGR